jgi:hypothetical protein
MAWSWVWNVWKISMMVNVLAPSVDDGARIPLLVQKRNTLPAKRRELLPQGILHGS